MKFPYSSNKIFPPGCLQCPTTEARGEWLAFRSIPFYLQPVQKVSSEDPPYLLRHRRREVTSSNTGEGRWSENAVSPEDPPYLLRHRGREVASTSILPQSSGQPRDH